MLVKPYRLTRALTHQDQEYSSFDLPEGAIVYHFSGPTYGCIGPGGIAVTLNEDGSGPFGQVPLSALEQSRDSFETLGWER